MQFHDRRTAGDLGPVFQDLGCFQRFDTDPEYAAGVGAVAEHPVAALEPAIDAKNSLAQKRLQIIGAIASSFPCMALQSEIKHRRRRNTSSAWGQSWRLPRYIDARASTGASRYLWRRAYRQRIGPRKATPHRMRMPWRRETFARCGSAPRRQRRLPPPGCFRAWRAIELASAYSGGEDLRNRGSRSQPPSDA